MQHTTPDAAKRLQTDTSPATTAIAIRPRARDSSSDQQRATPAGARMTSGASSTALWPARGTVDIVHDSSRTSHGSQAASKAHRGPHRSPRRNGSRQRWAPSAARTTQLSTPPAAAQAPVPDHSPLRKAVARRTNAGTKVSHGVGTLILATASAGPGRQGRLGALGAAAVLTFRYATDRADRLGAAPPATEPGIEWRPRESPRQRSVRHGRGSMRPAGRPLSNARLAARCHRWAEAIKPTSAS